jgi:cytochrome c peroxidase
VTRIQTLAGYRAMFAKAFASPQITIDHVAMAIATFERTILSGNAPFDRYQRGDQTALTAEQVRGMNLFYDKARCDRCHQGQLHSQRLRQRGHRNRQA